MDIELEKFGGIKEKFSTIPAEDSTSGLFIINSKATERLADLLHMNYDPQTQTVLRSLYVPRGNNHPYKAGLNLAAENMAFLATGETNGAHGTYYQLRNWLKNHYPTMPGPFGPMPNNLANAATVGMSIALSGVGLQFEAGARYEFRGNLLKLDPGKLLKFLDGRPKKEELASIMDRVENNDTKIPLHQMHFNHILDRFIEFSVPENAEVAVADGAVTMYQLIEHFWQDLEPHYELPPEDERISLEA